jgi:2-desacetyl-2-hydroxyethyl bacteriochlorophyllide A dehydrogenase
MKTLILEEPEKFKRIDTPEPGRPGPGQALLRVQRIGVCGTDLHAFVGRQPFFEYPRILGHELGVEVMAVGDRVDQVQVGDRCAVEPYLNCGACRPCRLGRNNCCEHLQVMGVHVDGGMREQIVVPANKLHVSQALEFEQLALVETMGIGAHAVDRAQLTKGDKVLVVGVGPIGLGVVQFAQIAGAEVLVIDADAGRRDFCRAQFGVEHALAPSVDSLAQLVEVLGGELPSTVFDATGNANAMMQSFFYVANAGQLVYVGFQLGEIAFPNPEFHRREMTMLSSRNAVGADFKRIIDWMEEGKIDTRPWITHRATFDDVVERFPAWREPSTGVVKAVLAM